VGEKEGKFFRNVIGPNVSIPTALRREKQRGNGENRIHDRVAGRKGWEKVLLTYEIVDDKEDRSSRGIGTDWASVGAVGKPKVESRPARCPERHFVP